MIAVDSNVLLRTLVDDEDASLQCRQARSAVGEADAVFVHPAVLLEVACLLSRAYKLPRAQVASILAAVCEHPKMRVEEAAQRLAVIELYRGSNIDFADAAILAGARHCGAELRTFDRKLGRLPGAAAISS